MPPTDLARLTIAAAVAGVLVWASVSDILWRKIPNSSVLAVLALFAAWTLANHGVGLVSSLEAAALAFVVTLILYAAKIMGAGDTKLFSAVALFAGLAHLPILAFATVMTGGVIALINLASRATRAMAMSTMRGKGDFDRGVPYGVAIAAGGLAVLAVQLGRTMPLPWSAAVRQLMANSPF